ncbi:MAG: phosphoadenosine phosphosulfate reductase family protein [Rhodospirillales bacterium]|nr:phosphoadenosine phosphosulfate reductase family protein [Rhodospirillales bacterium]
MTPDERLRGILHARLPGFQRKIAVTQTIIRNALRIDDLCWYAAFSGGIDSLVMLDLLWRLGIRCDVVWGDDGIDFPETLQFLTATQARYGVRLIRVRSQDPWRSWCAEMERPDLAEDPAALAAWRNPHDWDHQWRSLTKDAPGNGYGGVFLGMLGTRWKQGGESAARNHQLRGGWHPTYQVASEGGMWHCSPLAAWTKHDVWGYVAANDLPYNPVYDVQAQMGIPIERRRVSALTCFRAVQFGSHAAIRAGWPDLWNDVAETFPTIRRYS